DIQPIARSAALGWGVLEDEELARGLHRAATTRGDLALDEVDELADAVRLVDDVIASRQLQRVNDITAPTREATWGGLAVRGSAAKELGLGDDRELGVLELEPGLDLTAHEVCNTGLGV